MGPEWWAAQAKIVAMQGPKVRNGKVKPLRVLGLNRARPSIFCDSEK
jgi:hypothetical protein